jgi:hypothetical protein
VIHNIRIAYLCPVVMAASLSSRNNLMAARHTVLA